MRQATSLRSTLTAALIVVAGLALLSGAALVGMTTHHQRVVNVLSAAVESVRYAEEAQIDLLLHSRAQDQLVRAEMESDFRRRLLQADEASTSQEESSLVALARTEADAYFRESRMRRDVGVERAFSAVELVVSFNVTEARQAQASAARWNAVTSGLGIIIALALIAGVIFLIYWLRVVAFAPVFALAETIRRYDAGEREARAGEQGPSELREIARRFNEMSATLAKQRENQLAFLGGIAHDLRNPLQALTMQLSHVPDNGPLPGEEKVRAILTLVQRQVARLERMVEDFLDTAQIEAGKLDLRLQDQNLVELIRDAAELFVGASQWHSIEVRIPPEPVVATCDPARIEQVVNNLLSNAIKYSPKGGRVLVTLERADGYALLSVADQGMGMSAEDQAHLFEPFRRTNASRDVVPGTGLGLSIVRRIVEAHGGYIDVESDLGAGSTFRIHLPLEARSAATAPVVPRALPAKAGVAPAHRDVSSG